MNWSRSSILVAGIGLILLTNAVALGGVAYNRSGEPDSTLRLTERELQRPYDWGRNRENSGLAVTLRWRTRVDDTDAGVGMYMNYGRGSPQWLDEAKLAALGFDAGPQRQSADELNSRKVVSREVFLALESNGPAYRRALDSIRQHVAREEALKAANPGNNEMARRARSARERLDKEETEFSRLFVVDAGLDAARLRSVYTDRSRYAIVRGEVRPHWIMTDNPKPKLVGYVSGIHADRINVPLAFHSYFAPGGDNKRENGAERKASGEIAVAFGRRLEPWIVAAGAF